MKTEEEQQGSPQGQGRRGRENTDKKEGQGCGKGAEGKVWGGDGAGLEL